MNDTEGCEIYRTFDRQNPVVVRVEPRNFPVNDHGIFTFRDGRTLSEKLRAERDREVIRSLYYKEAPVADSVTSPSHYNRGSIEVKDFIADQNLNYFRGNAVKYISRAGFKPGADEVEDLRKAIQVLEFEIERVESSHSEEDEDGADWHDCDIAGCWED